MLLETKYQQESQVSKSPFPNKEEERRKGRLSKEIHDQNLVVTDRNIESFTSFTLVKLDSVQVCMYHQKKLV